MRRRWAHPRPDDDERHAAAARGRGPLRDGACRLAAQPRRGGRGGSCERRRRGRGALAGVEGAFAIDDVYVAGRIAAGIGGEPDESALAAIRLAGTYATAEDGIGGGQSAANIRRVGLAEDIPYCAQESLLDLAPRVVEQGGSSVQIAL